MGAETAMESVQIQIPSRPEYVRVVRLAVTGVASRMAFSYDDIEDIKLAVSEACNNAIQHSAAGDGPGAEPYPAIVVTLTPCPDRLEISVTDEGRVPPPGLAAPSPASPLRDVPLDELRESGLGLFLIQTLMDTVEHRTGNDSHTVVRMAKYLTCPSS